ncbi:adenosylcobinamide amidohydrolase [Alicyclobacillus sp. ALC3]|uniref:adenosylcobinamide amidohydrolase n=1 Tax=Alicyclobacillus sp. ALC3 TaxID=2796143 RepID=UPI0023789EBB|nr:adenosylcobinamide amidohydrolase [Alicyclobacillus sp. ALC3]WDL96775.1 adenosylcobinamide amidohydrolase [Alicyclobacillus sp. ALC3]
MFCVKDPQQSKPLWANRGVHWVQNSRLIHIKSDRRLRTISSAIHGGGMNNLYDIVNFKVPRTYNCDTPKLDLSLRLSQLGISGNDATALMTAARLDDAGWAEVQGAQWSILVCVTAGFSNAARVCGEYLKSLEPGTINTIVIVDGYMTEEAFVESVITVTEAKAAALSDLAVTCLDGRIATGTTTDAVVVGATQPPEYQRECLIEYTGLATEFGEQLAMAVYTAICESGQRYILRQQNNT